MQVSDEPDGNKLTPQPSSHPETVPPLLSDEANPAATMADHHRNGVATGTMSVSGHVPAGTGRPTYCN